MEIYMKSREEWRRWLDDNHNITEEIWLIYYKKPSGRIRIPYNDAVEEALCYGWIDGKIKRINDDYYIQRFTPRRKGSRWSKYNIDRVERLIKQRKMKKPGLLAYQDLLNRPELAYTDNRDLDLAIPKDLEKELMKNKAARENFTNYSPSVRRIYLEYLFSAKRPETRVNRINKIVALSEKNLKPGML
jgi:uncharacterized protein YdeI (YjbR/CyaY-like superfamily)